MATITQSDIAKELNVSRITVSKALRDLPDISDEMKQKVRAVAQRLGYVPNYTGRNLQLKKTYTIGVVVPDISNSFFSFAIHGIMDAASRHGYHIILTASRESEQIERENLMTLLSMRVDGLLVAVSRETTDMGVFKTIRKMNTPLVFFDRSLEGTGFSSVGINDLKDASLLVALALKNGYTKIAHFGGSFNIAVGRDRRDGYIDALYSHGIPLNKEWIIEGGFDKRSGYTGFRLLQAAGDLPEVIFAVNDRAALGAYQAIREAGLSIPEDIGVIAMGHHAFAEILSPPLTIIDEPPHTIGERAMELLVSEIESKSAAPRKEIIPTSIKINNSILLQNK